jgi:beta-glucosidase/6-phospho-beta-glucosidase/beta-galactosidase
VVWLLASVIGCGGGGDAAVDAGPTDGAIDLPGPRGPFPQRFLWGTAIAPYQVEGGLHDTDWYQWEELCDGCSGESADDGPDFWNRYDSDLANAASIGTNAIRIGLDWSRLFPTRVEFDARIADPPALRRYHEIIDAARSRGLTVMVTLIHFALPTWLHDLEDLENKPGWADPAIVDDVAAWAGWAAAEFGDDVDHWVTINEPMVQVVAGWVGGENPPGKSFAIDEGLAAGENMIYAHARAYDAIHEQDAIDADGDGEAALVSVAKHNRVFLPKDVSNPKHLEATAMLRYLLNELFLEAVVFGNIDRNYDFDSDDEGDVKADASLMGRLDYIGLNYYGVTLVIETATDNNFPMIGIPLMSDLDNQGLDGPISDFGWTIYPQGLRTVIDELDRFDLPIIITENGVADAADTLRPRFLVEHLYEVNKAIDDGVDIRGYFHWSLIDNFEWGSGYCPRFGLFRVKFSDPAKPRTAGEGAEVYRRIISDNTVDPQLFATYPTYGPAGYCPRVGL